MLWHGGHHTSTSTLLTTGSRAQSALKDPLSCSTRHPGKSPSSMQLGTCMPALALGPRYGSKYTGWPEGLGFGRGLPSWVHGGSLPCNPVAGKGKVPTRRDQLLEGHIWVNSQRSSGHLTARVPGVTFPCLPLPSLK